MVWIGHTLASGWTVGGTLGWILNSLPASLALNCTDLCQQFIWHRPLGLAGPNASQYWTEYPLQYKAKLLECRARMRILTHLKAELAR